MLDIDEDAFRIAAQAVQTDPAHERLLTEALMFARNSEFKDSNDSSADMDKEALVLGIIIGVKAAELHV